MWELERVKWKHITETWCVEQFGGDEQRRRGQGENWTHAGRICLGAVGEQNEGEAHHHGGQERVWSLKACQKLSESLLVLFVEGAMLGAWGTL